MQAESAEVIDSHHPDVLTIDNRADIHLRMISRDDVPELHNVMINNRKHLEQHLQTGELTIGSIGESVDWMIENIRNGSYLQYRIIADEKIIGSSLLYDIDTRTGVAKAGIWVDKKSEGKGYASAAMQQLMNYGFEKVGLKKIVFDIDPVNKRSEQLAQKLGARLKGDDILTETLASGHDFTYRVWEVDS